MGEVVVSSEGAMELEFQETEVLAEQTAEKIKNSADGSCCSAEVRWERFLPKMAVRVLLVEADDSTRQIVAALLRKCSYKVAAVADGLKAWEILKGQSHNIDLILTEVELPSISGYALLTLIMEHHMCKNIPVIMMSLNDSLSTVYKCMLRGAADFLVKPIRKNELRNLWQHVWRKQASAAVGPGPPDETAAQQKLEATAENNAISNHSSGYMTCIQRNRECIEKGSDTQSSCTKPETEGADIELVHCLSQVKAGQCLSDDKDICRQDESHQEGGETEDVDNEAREYQAMVSVDANRGTTQREDKNSSNGLEQDNATGQNPNHVPEHSSREAIDLLGNFGTFAASSVSANKFDTFPMLDLSLRRSNPSGSVNQVNDEPHRLNHSDASAFSRYINNNNNKISQPGNSTSASTCNQQKYPETNSEKQQSNHIPDYNSDTRGPRIKLSETTFSYSQKKEISEPIPVGGSRFENVINGGFCSPRPQTYCAQSGLSPSPSPGAVNHSQSSIHFNTIMDLTGSKQGQTLENFESSGHVSPSNDQSGNSSFCNGNINSTVKGVSECGNEESFNVQEGPTHRSMQREAALTKFRMKRKERCFEKKVRYESRKQLAEQRPRVKGQFVRQAPNDPQSSLAS